MTTKFKKSSLHHTDISLYYILMPPLPDNIGLPSWKDLYFSTTVVRHSSVS